MDEVPVCSMTIIGTILTHWRCKYAVLESNITDGNGGEKERDMLILDDFKSVYPLQIYSSHIPFSKECRMQAHSLESTRKLQRRLR